MNLASFLSSQSFRGLSKEQVNNLKEVVRTSAELHRIAGVKEKRVSRLDQDTIVIESGHQPNFLPYSGVLKKAFLAEWIERTLSESGLNTVSIFGIADYNLCTSKYLFQNRLPAVNKNGFVGFGLKKPRSREMWKRFNSLPKPEEEEWESLTQKLRSHYQNSGKEFAEMLIEEMWTSYHRGESLAEVNTILFIRLCRMLGIDVLFFRYSDLQERGVLRDSWEKVLEDFRQINAEYNKTVSQNPELGLKIIDERTAPFWYHCPCGGKVQTFHNGEVYAGECPVCGESYEIEDPLSEFQNLSPRAVPRNIIFSDGFGTSVFISGAGGGVRYGAVANAVSRALGFEAPRTIVWRSRDYYLGAAHRKVLREITRLLKVGESLNKENAISALKRLRSELALTGGEPKSLGSYRYSGTLLKIAANVFSTTPSIIDILSEYGPEHVRRAWGLALKDSEVRKTNTFPVEVERDVEYEEGARERYEVVKVLEKENLRADPLGILGGV
ncbi:hypothetical protein GAH_00207 [Geoglobus ahangari]|uniref:Uncharacterized protein n=1 Tax=Geoglobus ahangari TaxID=113653 RepID=A0A0F7DC92_9EURY|nr:hypothetical protein [Geoglobus ahangari]AKG92436.1 hypothetical protein GAH_00207 [Geoglobus ahangari]